jgi:hypothetical protein
MFNYIRAALIGILTAMSLAAGPVHAEGHAVICRAASFAGLSHWTKSIHALLGKDTTDPKKIKLFIGKDDGVTYIQSNFLSADPDQPGKYSEFPTKIRTNEADKLRQALLRIIYWGEYPPDAAKVVEEALKSAEVYVDRASIDQNGRIAVDVEGVASIRIVTETQSIAHGEISTLRLKKPPPALVETIDGCCFKGRPPGRARAITAALTERKIDPSRVSLLSFVVDSGTDAVIARSKMLSAARDRTGASSKDAWQDQLSSAFRSAKGGTLLLLAHINGTNIEVLDPAHQVLFSMPVAELREQARKAEVDLILFGCDTAAFIDEASGSIGVAGKYNTATAAARLDKALESSRNVADLLKGVASPDIVVVAYDEAGGNGYAGASAFARVRNTNFLARVFRLFAIRGS